MLALVIQSTVSSRRLNNYMNLEEMDPNAVTHEPDGGTHSHITYFYIKLKSITHNSFLLFSIDNAVTVKNGFFTWSDHNTTLKNINLTIKKGSLVAIVGQVGSGKSSLLSAILGEMKVLPDSKVNTVVRSTFFTFTKYLIYNL